MKNKLRHFPIAPIASFIYVAYGIWTGHWDKMWVIFLIIPIYYGIVRFLSVEENG
jgi:hypothetical protein